MSRFDVHTSCLGQGVGRFLWQFKRHCHQPEVKRLAKDKECKDLLRTMKEVHFSTKSCATIGHEAKCDDSTGSFVRLFDTNFFATMSR